MIPVSCLISGLLLGIAHAHLVRLIVFDESRARNLVALSGVLLYGLASCLCLFASVEPVGLVIAVSGPVAGFSVVKLTRSPVDAYQVSWGCIQAATAVLSLFRLFQILFDRGVL